MGLGAPRGPQLLPGPWLLPGEETWEQNISFFLCTELLMRCVRLGKEQQQLLLAARRKSVDLSAVSKVPRRVRLKDGLEEILERLR